MFPVVSEEENPHKPFATREEAQQVADAITAKPRSGVALVQYTGAWDCWLVEVRPRGNPYANAAVLRIDGTIAKYH